MEELKIIDTTIENVREHGVCGYKNEKRAGFLEKVGWLEQRIPEGLKMKSLVSSEAGTQGMIEYLPGEYCWRPVDAAGYMFVHCLFVGFKKQYKGRGYASKLIEGCEDDARAQNKLGVAVVTRKGSFMANKAIFIKRGYEIVDTAKRSVFPKSRIQTGLGRKSGEVRGWSYHHQGLSVSLYGKKCKRDNRRRSG